MGKERERGGGNLNCNIRSTAKGSLREREREILTVVRYDGGPVGVNSRGIHHNCLNSLILFADCHKVNHLARCGRDEAGWNKCGG